MLNVLIMLLMHYAADMTILLAVAVLVTLVVTANVRGLIIKLIDEPELLPCLQTRPAPRHLIRWADPDAAGRSRPRAPGEST